MDGDPVEVVAIDRKRRTHEIECCCADHAREYCDGRFPWWEVFDDVGNMIDSADKLAEEDEKT